MVQSAKDFANIVKKSKQSTKVMLSFKKDINRDKNARMQKRNAGHFEKHGIKCSPSSDLEFSLNALTSKTKF